MEVIPSGRMTEVSERHPEKANLPMEVTLAGMVMDVSERHAENALSPMNEQKVIHTLFSDPIIKDKIICS